jgi:hypothetical protein
VAFFIWLFNSDIHKISNPVMFVGMWDPTKLNFVFGKVGNLRFWKCDKFQPHMRLHQIKNIYLKVETKCSIKLKKRKEKRLRIRTRT